MKQYFKSVITIMALLISTIVYAGDTFESTDTKCKITFPGKYDVETNKEDDVTTVTVSFTQGAMIYMMIVSIHKETLTEDEKEGDLMEVLSLYSFASKLEAKIKSKKTFSFSVGEENGYYSYIKGKLDVGQKKKTKYEGNYYVIIRDKIMYQFTALGMKKSYNERPALDFADSFNFID